MISEICMDDLPLVLSVGGDHCVLFETTLNQCEFRLWQYTLSSEFLLATWVCSLGCSPGLTENFLASGIRPVAKFQGSLFVQDFTSLV